MVQVMGFIQLLKRLKTSNITQVARKRLLCNNDADGDVLCCNIPRMLREFCLQCA